jgi:rRNA small subunit methyltransferase G
MTSDRAAGLAFIGVSSQTEARLDKYVEFLARWRKVTNLISERAFSQVWTRHLADCAHHSCWVTRRLLASGSISDPAQGRAEVHCLALKVIRENARSYRRSLVRPMLLPAFMAVASKCSILACCHLWTQSPLGHWPPCLVSLNLPMNSLCSARSEFYRGDDRRQHRLNPFSVASQFQFKSFRNNSDPDARITAFTAATPAHRLKNDPRRSAQLDEKRRGCNRTA